MKTSLFDISLKYSNKSADLTDIINEVIQEYNPYSLHDNAIITLLKKLRPDFFNKLFKHKDITNVPNVLILLTNNMSSLHENVFKKVIKRLFDQFDVNDIYQIIINYLTNKKRNHYGRISELVEHRKEILSFMNIDDFKNLNMDNKKNLCFYFPMLVDFFKEENELVLFSYEICQKSNDSILKDMMDCMLFSSTKNDDITKIRLSILKNALARDGDCDNRDCDNRDYNYFISESIAILKILDTFINLDDKLKNLCQEVLDTLFQSDLDLLDLENLFLLKSFKFDYHNYLNNATLIYSHYSYIPSSKEFILELFKRENGLPLQSFHETISNIDFGDKELRARYNYAKICRCNIELPANEEVPVYEQFRRFLTGNHFKKNKVVNEQIDQFVKTLEFLNISDLNTIFNMFDEYIKTAYIKNELSLTDHTIL